MYIARVYEKIIDNRAIYKEKQQKIPTPEFIVLYNGTKPFPSEQTLSLSDAFISAHEPNIKFGSIDLTVRIVNINPGFNDELLQKSETLSDYTAFIEHVRSIMKNGTALREAVLDTIKWGLSKDILSTFLAEHELGVSNMLMTEFNIDIAKEVWQEEAREELLEVIAEKDTEIAEKDTEIAKKEIEINELKALVTQLQSDQKDV